MYEPRDPGYIEAEIAVEEYGWQGALDGRWTRDGIPPASAEVLHRQDAELVSLRIVKDGP